MPWKPLRHCTIPGCPERTNGGPCARHRAQQQRRIDQVRGTPAERGYDDGWAARAKRFLEAHPICCRCGDDATVANHRIRRRLLVAMRVADPDDERWLEPMCASCHGEHTATVEDRWGKR
jgi:5-methylcytosine-specific restriction protein A